MHSPLIECVPNVSEGRDSSIIASLRYALESSPEIKLLHIDSGYSANRTVFTFVGSPSGVLEASYRLIKSALELIDMRRQEGNHPRLGAVDVCPFVPLKKSEFELCISLSKKLAAQVSSDLNIPVYLYEQSARSESRKKLANIRRGQFEGLDEKLKLVDWTPDYGLAKAHPTFGALVTGARDFLIAYNINLATKNLSIAKKIAASMRNSGEKTSCRAIAWYVDEYNCCQVSTNLTNFEDFNMHQAYEKCAKLAKENNTHIAGSEVVGMLPLQAILQSGEFYLCKNNLKLRSSEEIIELAVDKLGLSSIRKFSAKEKIIEKLL